MEPVWNPWNLISPQDLNGLTRVVLINAIYFKGQWTAPFEGRNTQDTRFFLSPFRGATVKMMHWENRFAYGRADGVQILKLPYGRKAGLSTVVLLSRRFGGLATLQRSLSVDSLNRWLAALEPRLVRVYLPRFRFRQRIQLVPALRAMGMVTACSETEADFSGISNQQPGLCISSVIPEAFVEVDEKGTEAAAAAALLGAMMRSRIHLPPRILVFRADHPFIFLIPSCQKRRRSISGAGDESTTVSKEIVVLPGWRYEQARTEADFHGQVRILRVEVEEEVAALGEVRVDADVVRVFRGSANFPLKSTLNFQVSVLTGEEPEIPIGGTLWTNYQDLRRGRRPE